MSKFKPRLDFFLYLCTVIISNNLLFIGAEMNITRC